MKSPFGFILMKQFKDMASAFRMFKSNVSCVLFFYGGGVRGVDVVGQIHDMYTFNFQIFNTKMLRNELRIILVLKCYI